MLKLMEILGMLGPVAGSVLLLIHRRRAPSAAFLGIIGAVFTLAASTAGLVGERVAFFGGGGTAAIFERMEQWSTLRLILLLAGVALLTAASFIGPREGRRTRGIFVAVGWLAAAAGVGLPLLDVDIHAEHEFVNVLIPLILEAAQFAFLGIAALVLSIGVVTRRTPDGGPEPLAQAVHTARSLWGAYRGAQSRR